MVKQSWTLLFLTALFSSCEKTVQFTAVRQEPKLVVEATIETDDFPVVYLSTSLDFFSRISVDKLANAFVRNADITISDGQRSEKLREYTVPAANGYALYYYSTDTLNSSFRGQTGKTYDISISVGDKTYAATTTIPELTKTVVGLYYEKNVDKKDSSKVVLYGHFDDPPGYGNYIRYFTKVNDGGYQPGMTSVFDDQVIDGQSYNVQIDQGVDRNGDIDYDDYAFFHKGDTIIVKLCNIDKGVYDFWRTMEYSYSSIGNPFSSPTTVIGNVDNGALGYFGGYAVQYSSIIIPE